MAYEVLARKWRPQQLDQVIGQEHVARTLGNAIRTDHIAHAYLFVGPRGIGKTSIARIFAKALNCEHGPTPTPCDKCPACLEIMDGKSLDVIEMDAASNTGVDYIRELRENVLFAPARGPYKVYIIDEVHMLSTGAFNALLKTLEEPPRHVKFIMATTDPQKVLPTIISRCQRFDLRPIASRQIMEHIQKIARAEGVTISDDAALAIARGAEGGMRDAESTLDQLMAFCGHSITEQDVMSVFGLVARQKLEELMDALLDGDVPQAVGVVHELDQAGKDLTRLTLELLQHLRNMLILSYIEGDAPWLDLADHQRVKLREQTARTDAGRILRMIALVTEAHDRMRYALSRRTLLEVAVIQCARTSQNVSIDQLLAGLADLKKLVAEGGGIAAATAPVSPSRPAPTPTSPASPVPDQKKKPDLAADLTRLREDWHRIMEAVGRHATVHARNCLADAEPVEVLEQSVRVAFDPEFAGEKEEMLVPANKRALSQVLSEALGRPVTVSFEVLEVKEPLPSDHQAETASAPVRDPAHPTGGIRDMSPASLKKWTDNPQVRLTLETFCGDIVDIRV